ncbi:primosomal protein DnaI [Pseudogracilibacillus sp. SE30717A]|uniref:primosomal protein DnaI n=1 Tax=Pseudogracilibacillus sp. SE30717A TaxID=3098293 RepID=UPI00300E46D7
MKPIQTSLKRWINDNESFKQRHEAMKREILSHPNIVNFLEENSGITDNEIDKRLNKLYEYISQSIHCSTCKNYETCTNIVKGYSPNLEFLNGEIHISYEKCPSHIEYERMAEKQNLIKSMYMPKEILQAHMANVFPDPHRAQAVRAADAFIDKARDEIPQKGLFLTGPFGVGKTYLLGAIANELQKFNISSTLIYMPEFVREMREAIKDNTVQEKINMFKHADVLMLDDIGAETLSAWFRDEVLGSILQFRMMERLPVFFTSNYTMVQLEQILATSTKNGVEEVKAGRIIERIKQVSHELRIDGKNRRE